ncbi:hypothetical protein [Coleofasciculus sp. E2-BRE-01]
MPLARSLSPPLTRQGRRGDEGNEGDEGDEGDGGVNSKLKTFL